MEEQILAVDLSTEQTLEVNLPEQDNVAQIDVYWQDEVVLDLDASLMYIVSGQQEIQDYVDNKSKPEIDEYIQDYAKPIVAEVVDQIATPVIDEYFEGTVKPSITEFAENEMAGYAQTATEQVALAKEQADRAEETASTVTQTIADFNAQTEATKNEFTAFAQEKTEEFEQTAITATEQAVGSAERSRIWAEGEQAEVKPLGGELSSMGAADLAYAIANAPEDVPIDQSGMIAMHLIKGEKGDRGDNGIDGINGKDGAGVEIGDIGIAPFGIDESRNLRRYLNGQIILQSQFDGFARFVKEKSDLFPGLFVTEENWQAEVTNSKLGQCGKFVVDDEAGTIRLPKVININGLTDLALIGGIKGESLPNITGSFSGRLYGSPSGAFEYTVKDSYAGGASGSGYSTAKLNASLSSSTYQNNAPVQQEAVQYPYYIQVATAQNNHIDVTREIQLNNPFFLGMSQYFESEPKNASWLKSDGNFHSGTVYKSFYEWLLKIKNGTLVVSGISVKASTDDYSDYDYVINTVDTAFRLPNRTKDDFVVNTGTSSDGIWYRVYKSGWVEQCGYVNSDVSSLANGVLVTFPKPYKDATYSLSMLSSHGDTSNNGLTVNYANLYYGAFKRDSKTATSVRICGCGRWFASGQGVETPDNKTYFYVGETVQDANVINASGVLTRVAELKGYVAGMPDYSAGIAVSTTEYTAPCDGIINVGFYASGSSGYIKNIYVNGVVLNFSSYNSTGEGSSYIVLPVSKNDFFEIVLNTTTSSYNCRFFPFKGAK